MLLQLDVMAFDGNVQSVVIGCLKALDTEAAFGKEVHTVQDKTKGTFIALRRGRTAVNRVLV